MALQLLPVAVIVILVLPFVCAPCGAVYYYNYFALYVVAVSFTPLTNTSLYSSSPPNASNAM
jgi:hypothetical protein